jgi:hypothetical protein
VLAMHPEQNVPAGAEAILAFVAPRMGSFKRA